LTSVNHWPLSKFGDFIILSCSPKPTQVNARVT
jgi:hypothetical protein